MTDKPRYALAMVYSDGFDGKTTANLRPETVEALIETAKLYDALLRDPIYRAVRELRQDGRLTLTIHNTAENV
jgi:hypothetical protein